MMDPATLAQAGTALSTLFGPHIAATVIAAALLVALVAHGAMPWLPVPKDAATPYGVFYDGLRMVAGSYRNARPADAPKV